MIPTNKTVAGFSSFRKFVSDSELNAWKESNAEDIDKFFVHKQIVMTFVYPKDSDKNQESKIYGAMEDGGRLAFARMKDPKDENRKAVDSFQAFDLLSMLKNADQPEETQAIKIFSKKDLSQIKIISTDEAARLLSKKLGKNKDIMTVQDKKPNIVLKDTPDE